MAKLFIQIDHTMPGENFGWLSEQIIPVLSSFDLQPVVQEVNAFKALGPSFAWSDFHLNKFMDPIIFNSQMRQQAEAAGNWFVHLFITTRHTEDILGVMYDIGADNRARQGCAIFWKSIRHTPGVGNRDALERVLVRTALHEIGHCLNLGHRGDGTLMAQTQSIMRPNWVNHINLHFAPEDLQWVKDFPSESAPGGPSATFGSIEDVHIKSHLLQLHITTFKDSSVSGFTAGGAVSLLVHIKNDRNSPISFPDPTAPYNVNLKIWLKAPGVAERPLLEGVRGCGAPEKIVQIGAGTSVFPLHLFADNTGYLFNTAGTYYIRLAIRTSQSSWAESEQFSFVIREGSGAELIQREMINQPDILRYMMLAGAKDQIMRRAMDAIIGRAPTSDISRSLLWAKVYDLKSSLALRKKASKITEGLNSELVDTYKQLIEAETSQIRIGKLRTSLNTMQITGKPAQKNKNTSAIKKYNQFEQKRLKR